MADRVGQQLGNYRLIRLLGRGGFAEVYLGEHLRLKTQAAIKVLHTSVEDDDVEGFLREAQTVAHLKHPHIVRVFDFDVENHTPFLVMDYLPNGNVRRSHPKGTPLPLPTIISYVKQAASALHYAHDEKLIHRDVKPENMLVDRDNTLVLSDFGIALMAQSSRYQRTQEVAGTAAYMAPEQFQGKPHRASDQYSLGVVVYEWLCGDRPFRGTFTELYSQHMFVPPPSLREKMPMLSPDVEQVVLTALEKDPRQRFASVRAFATALEQASQSAQLHSSILSQAPTTPDQPRQPALKASPMIPLPQQTIALPTSEIVQIPLAPPDQSRQPTSISSMQSRPEPAHKGISRRTVVVSLAGLAVVGMAGGGLLWLTHSQKPVVPTWSILPTPTPILPPLGTTLYTYRGHFDTLWSVAWSLDSKRIASGSQDRTVQVWDATTGRDVYIYRGHSDAVHAVAWSPNGNRIASGSQDRTVQVWNAITGELVYIYGSHSDAVWSVAWSPNGTRIASASMDGTVQVWDATTGRNVYTYRGHSNYVNSVAWSPNGMRIASASGDGTVQVWDAATGRNVYTYRGHSSAVWSVAWSPDGNYVASGGTDTTVQVWDATTGNHIRTYRGHSQYVHTVAWSPDSQHIASGSDDRTAQVWKPSKGITTLTYRGHLDHVHAVMWSSSGTRIASGSQDTTVQVWQAL